MNETTMLGGLLAGGLALTAWTFIELRRAVREARAWRARHDALHLAFTRANAEADLVGSVEKERDTLRERLEYLIAEKSRLEGMAERVPWLERQVAALAAAVPARPHLPFGYGSRRLRDAGVEADGERPAA